MVIKGEGEEDYKQEKSIEKRKILGAMERIYSRRRYIGEKKKFEEHNGIGL